MLPWAPNDTQGSSRYLLRFARCGRPVWGRNVRMAMNFKTQMAALQKASHLQSVPAYKTICVGEA